jgi:hypothetical protein
VILHEGVESGVMIISLSQGLTSMPWRKKMRLWASVQGWNSVSKRSDIFMNGKGKRTDQEGEMLVVLEME